jgi:hypothetical protein
MCAHTTLLRPSVTHRPTAREPAALRALTAALDRPMRGGSPTPVDAVNPGPPNSDSWEHARCVGHKGLSHMREAFELSCQLCIFTVQTVMFLGTRCGPAARETRLSVSFSPAQEPEKRSAEQWPS